MFCAKAGCAAIRHFRDMRKQVARIFVQKMACGFRL